MTEVDQLVSRLNKPQELIEIIDGYQRNTTTNCNGQENNTQLALDHASFLCPDSIINLLVKIMGAKPNLIDDDVKAKVVKCFKDKNVKIRKMISTENLSILHNSGSQLVTWIKYESMLNQLIKEQIYEPNTMANEVLTIVKDELNPAIASKLASVIEGCVKQCRETNKGKSDEEMEDKWCEIIDWMSWFLASRDHDFV